MNSECITNPISSNQVTDVDLRKPACMDNCGNTLNDWLQWLAEKQCECDYENFDLSPIQELLQQEATDVNLCVILNSLVEAIETLNTNQEECCDEVDYAIAEEDWTPSRPLRALRKGRLVTLTGAAQANVSYTSDIANLPSALFPSTNLYFPVAHDFSPSAAYNVFLRILPTGEIKLSFTGTPPEYGANRTVYLDGVTFYLD